MSSKTGVTSVVVLLLLFLFQGNVTGNENDISGYYIDKKEKDKQTSIYIDYANKKTLALFSVTICRQ